MDWKRKAAIQNFIAALPDEPSYAAYYWLQRRFGGLKHTDPMGRLEAGRDTWRLAQQAGLDPVGRTFFEIGTGRTVNVPIAYWLMGAGGTVTSDLNPYLKDDLVRESVEYIAREPAQVRQLFGSLLQEDRLERLSALARGPRITAAAVLERCGISYLAPCDAARTGLPGASIDVYTSYTAFEHIAPDALRAILQEAGRIVKPGGLFVHCIDYSDHFAHSDAAICAMNYLQFSDAEWMRYAGNRYMYMNRLLHDDYAELFRSLGQQVLAAHPRSDARTAQALGSGALRPHARFAGKPAEVLAIKDAWYVARNAG